MLIENAFKTVKCGKDPNKMGSRPNDVMHIKKIQKSSMKNSKFIESRFVDDKLPFIIDDKYFLKKEDIIISLKEPYMAATISSDLEDKVLIPNNYAVLRNINNKKYNYIFVTNYLNLIAINKVLEKKKKLNNTSDLTLTEVKEISLPDIPLTKQETLINLFEAINGRAIYYEMIMDNDKKIIEYALKEVLGDKDV